MCNWFFTICQAGWRRSSCCSAAMLPAILAGSCVLSSALAEDRGVSIVDWSEQVADGPAQTPSPDIYFQPRHGAEPRIVGAGTDPASPFGEESQGLYVGHEGGDNAVVSMAVNPFLYDVPPAKGWVEFDFAVVEGGTIPVGLGADSSATQSPAASPSYDGRTLLTLFLIGGRGPILLRSVDGEDVRTTLAPEIEPEMPHRLRIEWDWHADAPGVRLHLDGEPLATGADLEPVFIPVDVAGLSKGVDFLSLFIHRGSFLGAIRKSE